MITNLYAKYLLADRLNKAADAAGLEVAFIEIDDRGEYTARSDVHLQITQAATRDTVDRLLAQLSDLTVTLENGLLYLRGVSRTGLSFDFYLGRVRFEEIDEIRELVSA